MCFACLLPVILHLQRRAGSICHIVHEFNVVQSFSRLLTAFWPGRTQRLRFSGGRCRRNQQQHRHHSCNTRLHVGSTCLGPTAGAFLPADAEHAIRVLHCYCDKMCCLAGTIVSAVSTYAGSHTVSTSQAAWSSTNWLLSSLYGVQLMTVCMQGCQAVCSALAWINGASSWSTGKMSIP